MGYVHNTNLSFDGSGGQIHNGAEAAEGLRQRIASLKQSNSTHYLKENEKLPDDDAAYLEILDSCNKFIRANGFEEEKNLAQTLEKYNLQLYCYKYDETSKDKKAVARMAFNGYVDRPMERDLSPTLRNLKNNPANRTAVSPESYDLSHSSVWSVFKQVPEFAAIEEKLKKGLSVYGILPQDLPKLNLKDFCFVINEQFRGGRGDSAKVFKQSYKAKNTIRFINENEAEFRQGLLAMKGVRTDYVDALVGAMKQGNTDLTKLRDRSGRPVWKEEWENQPVVDVHHIVNIKDAATREQRGESFTSINDYGNMCFIVRHPQHNAMHALEQDLNGNYHEDIFYNRRIDKKFIYRIQPPEGVKCMLGFNNMIYDKNYLAEHNLAKEDVVKQAHKDKNYYQNRHRLSDKQAKLSELRKANKHKGVAE